MTDMRTDATIDGVDVTARIDDGRVSMCATISTELYVKSPEHAPLSEREPHLELRAADDDVRVTLDLDGAGLAALVDALEQAQQTDG